MLTAQGNKTGILHCSQTLPAAGLICSHPQRVRWIVEHYLQRAKLLSDNRGYELYLGYYQDRPLFCANVAIGAASAALILEELIVLGAKTIIRLGTADHEVSPQEEGRLYVVESVAGLDGLAAAYGFDAPSTQIFLSSEALNAQLFTTAKRLQMDDVQLAKAYHLEAYYVQRNPKRFAHNANTALQREALWHEQGRKICDMESAALFMLGGLRQVQTASVLQALRKHQAGHELQEKQHRTLVLEHSARLVLETLIGTSH